MGRGKRAWVHQYQGSVHLISRIGGGDFLLQATEKEYFVKLMFKFAKGFFVDIHAYSIMSNHFHILATELNEDAAIADKDDLISRYKTIYGRNADYPEGSYKNNGELIPDDDGGIERLRCRLGSISRFVQELKQTFSKWYNWKHNRKGYLWSDRFKSVIMEKGDPEFICSAYIDLNPVRAGLVKKPEDYRWSSIGLRVRNPLKAKKLLKQVRFSERNVITKVDSETGWLKQTVETLKKEVSLEIYRVFLYGSGCKEVIGKAHIHSDIYGKGMGLNGKLKLGDKLKYRFRNLSEGIAIGSFQFIENIQVELERKLIKPRQILNGEADQLYSTRRLNPI